MVTTGPDLDDVAGVNGLGGSGKTIRRGGACPLDETLQALEFFRSKHFCNYRRFFTPAIALVVISDAKSGVWVDV